jgi:hypothetical protein
MARIGVVVPDDLHLRLRRWIAELEFDYGFKTSLQELVTATLDTRFESRADVRRLVEAYRERPRESTSVARPPE